MNTTHRDKKAALVLATACLLWLALAGLLCYGLVEAGRAPASLAPAQLLPEPARTAGAAD